MKTLVIVSILAFAICAFGQEPTTAVAMVHIPQSAWTNSETVSNIIFREPTYYVNPPQSTAADIAKVFEDFGVHVSVGSIASILALIVMAARMLRKAVPDTQQTGPLWQLVKHVGLEINPVTPPSTTTPVVPAESKNS